jgi:hypothetical protein
VILVSVVVVAFLGDLGYSLLRTRSGLLETKQELSEARASIADGEANRALGHVEAALDASQQAKAASNHPALQIVERLPWVGRDVRALTSLATAGALASRAADTAVDAAQSLGLAKEGVAESIYTNGRVNFAAINGAQPAFHEADALLAQASEALRAAPAPVLGVVDDALRQGRSELSAAGDAVAKGDALLSALPGLLGEDGERSYLLAFQALGEARGTGGVIGLYGILDITDGRPRLTHIGPFTDFQRDKIDPVAAPEWFSESYGPQLALRQWQQANLSPNFPAVAKVLLRMYTEGTGAQPDGVIAMDPVALGYLLEGTGPITAPGLDVSVGPDNAAEVLMHDTYLELPRAREQNAYLAGLVDEFWGRIRDGDYDVPAFSAGLAEAVSSQHFKVYSSETDELDALKELGASGAYDTSGSNVQLVFNDNYSANKVDYFLQRQVDTTVQLLANGDAQAETTVTLTNASPPGPKSFLLGPVSEPGSRGDPPGMNRMILNLLLPKGARGITMEVDGKTDEPFEYSDDGFPVVWKLLEVPAGEVMPVKVRYFVPAAADLDDGAGTFDLTLFPQATVNPDQYTLTVGPPVGSAIAGPGETEAGPSWKISGTLNHPQTYGFRVVSP